MTPAQLVALLDVHNELHSDKPRKRKPKPSANPAADLAQLGAFS